MTPREYEFNRLHREAIAEQFHYDEWLANGGREWIAALDRSAKEAKAFHSAPVETRNGNAIELSFPNSPRPIHRMDSQFREFGEPTGESIAETGENGGFSVRPLADSDEGPFYNIERNPQYRFLSKARKFFLESSIRETGNTAKPEALEKKRAENQLLKDQSHRIASILEANGIPAYQSGEHNIYIEYLHSGKVEQIPKFRRICFLPYVASRIRGPMVAALEAYLEQNPFARMWTFTSGKRVKTKDVRNTVTQFHRKLSKLASWLRTQGVEMVFRSTELGTPELEKPETGPESEIERDDSGNALFHVHAHTMVRLIDGPMTRERWDSLVKSVWKKWGHHWDAGESVRDCRELCKYVFKPGELLSLKDSELVELYHQLRRLKIVAPLGELRDDIKRRSESKLRLVREPTPDGKVYREREDWNRELSKRNRAEKAHDNAVKAGLTRKPDDDSPRIVAQCLPGFAPGSTVKEPRVVVLAKFRDREKVLAHPAVKELADLTRPYYHAGARAADFIRVHTGTPTVPAQDLMEWIHDIEERTRPPSEPLTASETTLTAPVDSHKPPFSRNGWGELSRGHQSTIQI